MVEMKAGKLGAILDPDGLFLVRFDIRILGKLARHSWPPRCKQHGPPRPVQDASQLGGGHSSLPGATGVSTAHRFVVEWLFLCIFFLMIYSCSHLDEILEWP